MKIIEVNHGIANRFQDGTIEVNENLIRYPSLYKPIMRHELEHTDKTFSIQDFKHDINSNDKVDQIKLLLFMFKYPRSFTQLLPFYYSKKRKFVIDINLSIVYSLMLGAGVLLYFFLF